MNTPKNTRIAPSPTGLFHIGTARTAYHNWLASRATNGKFILRIDDTDVARNTQANVDLILRSMDWLDLPYDAIYYQSKRMELYRDCLNRLKAGGLVRTGADGELRLIIPREMLNDTWQDTIVGSIKITHEDWGNINDMVIARRDGSPVYQFATVVDDMDMHITDIIRGVDHISNSPKQLAIRSALQAVGLFSDGICHNTVRHSHVGLITLGHAKISKRKPEHAEVASLQTYIDRKYKPEALLNFLLRLGWSPKGDGKDTNIIPRSKALELFLPAGNLRNANAKFDQVKLDWYNRQYTNKKMQ